MVDLERDLEAIPSPPPRKPKSSFKLWLIVAMFATIISISTGMIFSQSLIPDWLYRITPLVPHRLDYIVFMVNNQSLVCKAGESCLVRPPDKILLKSVKTDGTISLGIELYSPDFDPRGILAESRSFIELFPQLDFDKPREFTIEVFWLRWPIGKVALVAKWTIQDWLERARAAESLEKKEYFLSRALEEAPEHIFIRNQLAGVLVQQKKYLKAAEQYEILFQKQPLRVFMERLPRSYAAGGNKHKAVESYVDLINRYPDKTYVKEWLDYLRKSMSTKDIVKVAESYSSKLPEQARSALFVFVSDVCASVKDWDCVAEYSERALKTPARSPTLAYNAAAALFQKKDYGRAIEYLKRYITDYPNDMDAHKMLALSYEHLKQWDEAEAVYRKIIESGRASEDLISKWIEVVGKTNDKGKLLNAYQRLSLLKPQDPTVWYNLGVLQNKEGKKEEARKAFEKVLQLKPNDLNSLKYLRILYKESKNTVAEKEVVKKLISLEPNVEDHYNDFFTLSNKEKDYDEVVSALNTCVNKNPKAVTCYNNLLYMYLKRKKEREAINVLEKLVELQPTKPELLFQAAKLLYNQKEYDRASGLLKRYLDKKPDDETAQDLYLEIRKKATIKEGSSGKTTETPSTTPKSGNRRPQ
ncbi:MAG: tetratricopeptide repeat protein [Syntrophobacterales bacterium]|nr:tetratricopeptide repeat protein [Syntrophobacterales bacterium]